MLRERYESVTYTAICPQCFGDRKKMKQCTRCGRRGVVPTLIQNVDDMRPLTETRRDIEIDYAIDKTLGPNARSLHPRVLKAG